MDESMDSRLERILTTREEPIRAYIRSKSTEQPMPRIIQTTKSGQLAVFERKSHKYAAFVPPTADRTPRLFPYPIPWDKQSHKPMCLGWKPPVYTIEGWSDPVKFSDISETRKQQLQTPSPKAPLPDPITGYPRNPGGRTGVSGKGNLPEWGANSAIIIVITRQSGEFSSDLNNQIKESFRVIAHKITLGSQLPWYLVQHPTDCNLKVCVKEIFSVATQSCLGRLTKLKPEKRAILEQTLNKFNHLPIKIIYSGYIDDTVNTDNAWIEPIVVHRHVTDPEIDCDELLQLFAVEGANVIWLDPEDKVGMRPSHEKILQKVGKRIESRLDTSKTKREVTFLEDV